MSITMGNDEFILYIRKNFINCPISNDQLGKTMGQPELVWSSFIIFQIIRNIFQIEL